MTKIEPLPETKTKNGFNYELVKRSKNAAIYKQSTSDNVVIGYEVFKIVISKAVEIPDKNTGKLYKQPTREKFPGNEDFGKIAWAYTTIGPAENRYKEIESVKVLKK